MKLYTIRYRSDMLGTFALYGNYHTKEAADRDALNLCRIFVASFLPHLANSVSVI